MPIKGKPVKITRWIHGRTCVVRVEVDAITPDGDLSEPCLEPQTVRWLDELQQKTDAGNIDELDKLGEVFVRRSA